jgi:hypothetical protein
VGVEAGSQLKSQGKWLGVGGTFCGTLRTFVGIYPSSSQSSQNSQQPRTFEHRLLLFLLTERGPNEDFLTSVCEHCEILGWFGPDVHSELNSDLLAIIQLLRS